MAGVNHDIMVCFFDIIGDAFREHLKLGTLGVFVRDGRIFLRFNMNEVKLRIFNGGAFNVPGVGPADCQIVSKILREKFNTRTRKGSIGGRLLSVYDLDIDEIREMTGVYFVL